MDFAHIPVLLEPCMELLNLAQRLLYRLYVLLAF